MEQDQIKAILMFGKLGMQMAAMRIVSVLLSIGGLALAGFVAYSPSWQGAIVTGIIFVCGLIPALRTESKSAQKGE